MNIKLMSEIEAKAGRKLKEDLLATADVATQRFIRFATDTYITFGITLDHSVALGALDDETDAEALFGGKKAQARKTFDALTSRLWWTKLELLLTQLQARSLTGTAAHTAAYELFAQAPTADDAEWGLRVLHKDLACGVSVKTVCKVFPGLITPFAVMLASPLDDDDVSGEGYIEPKYDGERCVVLRGVALSRYGHELLGAKECVEALRKIVPDLDQWVFDGELYKHGTTLNLIHGLASNEQVVGPRGLTLQLFDCMPIEHWEQQDSDPLNLRRGNLETLIFEDQNDLVQLSPINDVQNPSYADLMAWRDHYRAQGYEGAMWKRVSASYQWKRCRDVLKLKMFEPVDGRVVDRYEGEGKYTGMLGGFVVELPGGAVGRCGGGFSDQQRTDYWNDWPAMKDRWIEMKAQEGKTKNGKLRHGTFIRPRPDLDDQ